MGSIGGIGGILGLLSAQTSSASPSNINSNCSSPCSSPASAMNWLTYEVGVRQHWELTFTLPKNSVSFCTAARRLGAPFNRCCSTLKCPLQDKGVTWRTPTSAQYWLDHTRCSARSVSKPSIRKQAHERNSNQFWTIQLCICRDKDATPKRGYGRVKAGGDFRVFP